MIFFFSILKGIFNFFSLEKTLAQLNINTAVATESESFIYHCAAAARLCNVHLMDFTQIRL